MIEYCLELDELASDTDDMRTKTASVISHNHVANKARR